MHFAPWIIFHEFAPWIIVHAFCNLGNFSCFFFLLSADFFFSKSSFSKILSGVPSGCQTVWSQIRPNILSGLIPIQTAVRFFANLLFPKILSVVPSECQTVWIQIRPDILSGLIWVQTVCKGYKQTTLVGK